MGHFCVTVPDVTNGSLLRHAKLSLSVPDVLSKKFSSNLSAHLPPHILPKVRRAFVAHRVQRVNEVHESYFLRITSHCSLRSSRSLLHASSAMHLMPWHSLMQRRIPLQQQVKLHFPRGFARNDKRSLLHVTRGQFLHRLFFQAQLMAFFLEQKLPLN